MCWTGHAMPARNCCKGRGQLGGMAMRRTAYFKSWRLAPVWLLGRLSSLTQLPKALALALLTQHCAHHCSHCTVCSSTFAQHSVAKA